MTLDSFKLLNKVPWLTSFEAWPLRYSWQSWWLLNLSLTVTTLANLLIRAEWKCIEYNSWCHLLLGEQSCLRSHDGCGISVSDYLIVLGSSIPLVHTSYVLWNSASRVLEVLIGWHNVYEQEMDFSSICSRHDEWPVYDISRPYLELMCHVNDQTIAEWSVTDVTDMKDGIAKW